MTQSRPHRGHPDVRKLQRRLSFRRGGAVLGILALLVQCLVLAFHHPAQAAYFSPFQDPAAWCGSVADAGSGAPAPDGSKAPLRHGFVCPICQSLHAAGTGLVPVLALLVGPMFVGEQNPPAIETVNPTPFGQSAVRPRAPPVAL